MTSLTRLDDQQCQALCGGGMPPVYKPQVCRPSYPSSHVSTKYMSKASTYLAQGNAASNTSIGLGGFAGWANAESFQANGATIFTSAG
jgi:hypothetical protein